MTLISLFFIRTLVLDVDKEFIHFFGAKIQTHLFFYDHEMSLILVCPVKIYQGYHEKVFSNVGLPKNNLKLTDIPLDN